MPQGNVRDESIVDVKKAKDALCEADGISQEILIQVNLKLLAREEPEVRLQLRGVETSSAVMLGVSPAVVDPPPLRGKGLAESKSLPAVAS